LKEEIIVRILDKAYNFLDREQIEKLRNILNEELCHYTVVLECTDLALTDNLTERILIYAASKRLDGISLKTIRNYLYTLKKFADALRRDVELINAMDIRMYLARYSQLNEVENSTMATMIWILKAFFGWLQNEDYIVKNPMCKIKATKVEKRLRDYLTQIELEHLRIACRTKRDTALVEVFYSTGCRLSEIYALNKSDIDWNNDSCLVIGKGNKERRVYFNAKARVHLWRYFDSRKDDNNALFVSDRAPYDRLSCRSIEEVFEDIGSRAGLNKHVHPHIMRHTFAMAMLKNGASMAAIQQLLGHSDIGTTMIYCHLNDDELKMIHKKCS